MKKFNSKAFRDLLAKLSQDPKIKKAIDQAKLQAGDAGGYKATSILDFIVFLLKYSGAFIGKKKAEKVTEFTGYLVFLITVSLLLKKNVFDNPDVREFFMKHWAGAKSQSLKVYEICQKYVNETISTIKAKRAKRT